MAAGQITHLLVVRLAEHLKTFCMDQISSSDPTRARYVHAYKFQESPIEDYIYICPTGGNPKDPEARDGRVRSNEMDNLGLYLPSGEVGGGHYWWRHGRITVGCFFITKRFTQLVSGDYAHKVLGRVQHYAGTAQVNDLVDEFGEQAFQVMVYATNFFEGGGPPDQYIWRGEVLWQALTHGPI
jgi:hypothetical protein